MYSVAVTTKQIDDVMNEAVEQTVEGTKWPRLSYEEGVNAALRWVFGLTDESPMDD